MADQLEIGTRVLFVEHAGGKLNEGIIRSYSPKGNICVDVGFDRHWYAANAFFVVEELPKPEPAKVEAAPDSPPSPRPSPPGEGETTSAPCTDAARPQENGSDAAKPGLIARATAAIIGKGKTE